MNNKDVITGYFVNEQIYSKEYNNTFYNLMKQIGVNFFDFILIEIKNIYKYQYCSCNSYKDNNDFDYYVTKNLGFKINKSMLNKIIKNIIDIISKKVKDESLKYSKEIHIEDYSYIFRKGLLNDTKKINKEIDNLTNLGLQLERIYEIMYHKDDNLNIIYYIPEDDYLEEWKKLNISKMKERT
jgi:hypothetical protein